MKRFKNILYVSEPSADQDSSLARAVSLAENNQNKKGQIQIKNKKGQIQIKCYT
jgi:hypothetical protein